MCEEEQNPEKPEDVRDNGRKAFPREYNHRREATVYDAVAGRVGLFGFARNRTRSFTQAALPIDVLFRRKRAPEYARDVYAVNRTDESYIEKNLPESDLLKAIHGYVSEFYSRAPDSREKIGYCNNGTGQGKASRHIWRSMDETALLALGILLEEACGDVLDEIGWKEFIESNEETKSLRLSSKRKFEDLN